MKISKPEGFPVELETEEIEILEKASELVYSMKVNLSDNNLTEYVDEEYGCAFDNERLNDLYDALEALQRINIAY
jgi:hypothetical protein